MSTDPTGPIPPPEDEPSEETDESEEEQEEQDSVDRQRGSSVTTGDQLGFESELTLVGNADASIVINETAMPGAYRYRRMGDGRESQYLKEISAGGGGGSNPYDADNPPEQEEGGESSDSDDEPPPESITVEAYAGHETAMALRELRQLDEQFPVSVGGETLEDMELSELEIEASGVTPFSYHVVAEVREWRKVEIDEGGGTGDTDYGQGDGEDIELEDIEESGTEDEPNQITVSEGDTLRISVSEGERFQYADIDATAEGADVQIAASGENWEISNVSIRGGDDQTPAIATDTVEEGEGVIENVVIDGEPISNTDGDDESDGEEPDGTDGVT